MQKESRFEKKFIDRLKALPYSYWPDKGAAGSIIGNADRHGCIRGRYVSLEFKRSFADALKYTPRKKLQEYTVHKVQEAQGFGAFVYPENAEEVFRQIERFSHE